MIVGFKMMDSREIDTITGLINQEKDLIKGWWVTLTGVSSALIVGSIFAYVSGKINSNSEFIFEMILFSVLPILTVVLIDLFFNLIELNEKAKKLTIYFWKHLNVENKWSFDRAIDLVEVKIFKHRMIFPTFKFA